MTHRVYVAACAKTQAVSSQKTAWGKNSTQVGTATGARGIVRLQWMANWEGGQTYGNQEEIRPLKRDDFEQYVKERVEPSDFEQYMKKYPDTYISVVRQGNTGEWRLSKVGSRRQLMPRREAVKEGLGEAGT